MKWITELGELIVSLLLVAVLVSCWAVSTWDGQTATEEETVPPKAAMSVADVVGVVTPEPEPTPEPTETPQPTPQATDIPVTTPEQTRPPAMCMINPDDLPAVYEPGNPAVEPTPETFVFHSDAVPLSEELQQVLFDACREFGVDLHIAIALIETESNFQVDADNGQCYGLTQLCRLYFPSNLTPAENIQAGMELLGRNFRQSKDWGAALTMYNVGHDDGTRVYANVVLARAEKWRGIV